MLFVGFQCFIPTQLRNKTWQVKYAYKIESKYYQLWQYKSPAERLWETGRGQVTERIGALISHTAESRDSA